MNKTLEKLKIIQELCIFNRITLGSAESCTGGLLSHYLTNLSNSSKIYQGSLVAYSNDIKINLLHVPEEILKDKGAVSREVSILMADGLLNLFNINIAIAITGIMETRDDKSSKNKQAYITIKSQSASFSGHIQLTNDRISNKESTAIFAINNLLDFIQKNYLLS